MVSQEGKRIMHFEWIEKYCTAGVLGALRARGLWAGTNLGKKSIHLSGAGPFLISLLFKFSIKWPKKMSWLGGMQPWSA